MAKHFHFTSGLAAHIARGDYLDCVDRICRSDEGQGLYWFDDAWLLASGATLVLANHVSDDGPDRFAGGLSIVKDGAGAVSIRGAVVEPAFRGHGLLRRLAARGRLVAGHVPVHAVVRVYPDDRANLASLLSLAAVGLNHIDGIGRAFYRNTPSDSHLRATLEGDGLTFRYLKLSADACLKAARREDASHRGT